MAPNKDSFPQTIVSSMRERESKCTFISDVCFRVIQCKLPLSFSVMFRLYIYIYIQCHINITCIIMAFT